MPSSNTDLAFGRSRYVDLGVRHVRLTNIREVSVSPSAAAEAVHHGEPAGRHTLADRVRKPIRQPGQNARRGCTWYPRLAVSGRHLWMWPNGCAASGSNNIRPRSATTTLTGRVCAG